MKEPRYRSDPGTEEAFYAGREDAESGRSRQPDTLATFAAAVHAVKQEPLRRWCRSCGNEEYRHRPPRFQPGTVGYLNQQRAWPPPTCECEQPDWYQESKDWEVGYEQGFAYALEEMTGKQAREAAANACRSHWEKNHGPFDQDVEDAVQAALLAAAEAARRGRE